MGKRAGSASKAKAPEAPAKIVRAQRGGKVSPRPHKPGKGGSIPPAATKRTKAGVAQSAERAPSKHQVAGSSPAPRSKKPKPAASSPAATVAKLITATAKSGPDRPLTPEHEAFITEYLRNGRNGTAAYLSVYPKSSPAAASVSSWHLLRNPKLSGRIRSEVDRLARKHVMTRDDMLADLVAIVRADPADLMQMRHVSCDECWPKAEGPLGNWTEPNPECVHCAGQGILKPWIADTRKLSPDARALFAGIKVTKDGIQVLTESKDAAREKIAKILGAYEKDNEQKKTELPAQLATFLGELHSTGAGRLPLSKVPRK